VGVRFRVSDVRGKGKRENSKEKTGKGIIILLNIYAPPTLSPSHTPNPKLSEE
jgi:hypothetical protein